MALHKKGEFDKAIADFDAAIRLNPRSAVYRINRGAAWENKADFGRALADFDAAVRLDPQHAGCYNNRAYLLAACPDDRWRSGEQAVRDAATPRPRAVSAVGQTTRTWARWPPLTPKRPTLQPPSVGKPGPMNWRRQATKPNGKRGWISTGLASRIENRDRGEAE